MLPRKTTNTAQYLYKVVISYKSSNPNVGQSYLRSGCGKHFMSLSVRQTCDGKSEKYDKNAEDSKPRGAINVKNIKQSGWQNE